MLNKVDKSILKDALVVKLVDTKDLKSLPFWECQFESGRGHHKFNEIKVSKYFNSIKKIFNIKY